MCNNDIVESVKQEFIHYIEAKDIVPNSIVLSKQEYKACKEAIRENPDALVVECRGRHNLSHLITKVY